MEKGRVKITNRESVEGRHKTVQIQTSVNGLSSRSWNKYTSYPKTIFHSYKSSGKDSEREGVDKYHEMIRKFEVWCEQRILPFWIRITQKSSNEAEQDEYSWKVHDMQRNV